MNIIVGLGNPGKKYILTPHNIGWIVVDALSTYYEVNWLVKKKHSCETAIIEKEKILLVKPLTYMNLSGLSVKSLIDYYKVSLDNLLVIHDDIDLPFLSFRFHKNRGPAGHNGLKSINKELGSQDYSRMRIGMGAKPVNSQEDSSEGLPATYSPINIGLGMPSPSSQINVLKPFTKEEQSVISGFLNTAISSVEYFLSHGWEKTANRYNSPGSPPARG